MTEPVWHTSWCATWNFRGVTIGAIIQFEGLYVYGEMLYRVILVGRDDGDPYYRADGILGEVKAKRLLRWVVDNWEALIMEHEL